jgi:AraC-like DNA-binding protein
MAEVHKRQFDKQKVEEIRSFISSNLKNELNVEKLSGKFGCSPWTFKRQFQYSFKQSVRNYILDCRMQKAVLLLKEGVTTVNQIAYEVGYKNRTSFTHAFSHHFGYPPVSLLEIELSHLC